VKHPVLFIWLALQIVSPEGAQHMQAGMEAHKQGRFDAAIAEFRKATESDPNLSEAFLDLGEELMQTHDYGAAVAPLRRALELRPDLDAAHLQLGYALLSLGYAAEAIPHLKRVPALEALGIAQIETGQYEEAVANLSAALVKRPNDADLLYYLGRASGLLSKRSIDTLLSVDPDSARAHQAMGENYFVLRQMPQAEQEYREALRQRPDIPGLQLELGLVHARSAQWDKAEEAFRAEAKRQPGNAEAAYRFGAALLQQGKVHEARAELERADRLQPDMPETLYLLGKAASLDADLPLAEKSWTRVIALEKETSLAAQAHFGLASLYRRQGKTAEAQHEMQEFKRLQSRIERPRPQPE
jgi:tetratricopeptide (TPR) repeat protein